MAAAKPKTTKGGKAAKTQAKSWSKAKSSSKAKASSKAKSTSKRKASSTPKGKPSSAKQVATAYFDAIAARDTDAMAACWRPGSLDHFYGMATLRVPEGLHEWFGNLFRAFPDFAIKVEEMLAYGDKAAVRWSAQATFSGPGKFEGFTATGASIEMEGLDLLTIADGEIVENRAYTNALELARRMGAVPPQGSHGEKAMFAATNARTAAAGALKRVRSRARR